LRRLTTAALGSITDSFSGLTKTLRRRFDGASFADKHRIELKNRRRTKGETLKALHSDVRRLAALAFPDMDQKNREVVSCDYFIDALDDPEFGLKIREKHPVDLDSALCVALQLEVWVKDSERHAGMMDKAQSDSKKVREFTKSDSNQHGKSDFRKIEVAELRKLVSEQQKVIEALQIGDHVDALRPTSANENQKPKGPVSCYRCGQLGHIARNCPVSLNQSNAAGTSGLVQHSGDQNPASGVANSRPGENNAAQQAVQRPSTIQHVRPISEKRVHTCLRVRYKWHRMYALLDTGSDVTIAGRDMADRCDWILQGGEFSPIQIANGDELAIDGKVRVPIRVGGRSTEVDVLVTPDITGLILGVNWIEQKGPVTWDFQNNRIRFGEDGKWIALHLERQWPGVCRVFRSQYAMSRASPTVTRMVRKITRGQKGNVFGLAGGGLPPRRSTVCNCKCLT